MVKFNELLENLQN